MSSLTAYLDTQTPKILDIPAGIPFPSDPVSWALDMFKADISLADMQSMEQDPDDDTKQKIVFFDQQDPECFPKFSKYIHEGSPVHGNLELIDYRDDGGEMRENAEWAWQVVNEHFMAGLNQKHSMGYYLKSNLWMSCGEHCYKAHCDFADGFLMHINGSKHVRVWPVPKEFQEKVIFDHSNFQARMTTEPCDFELQPGQVLFIPASAMHEVVAHGEQPAVSVSFHMGSPYLITFLCNQLNKLQPGAELYLPPHLTRNSKFDMSMFQLSRFAHLGGGADGKTVPAELAAALLKALQSRKLSQVEINNLLKEWWGLALSQPIYPGPPKLFS